MEKFITATGKSIDLAIEAGLTQLGMDRDSVSVEILETPIMAVQSHNTVFQ